jgi:hypothetical protein
MIDKGKANARVAILNKKIEENQAHPQDQLHHTVITIDIASYVKGQPHALLEQINDVIGHSTAGALLDIDEWKVTVKQVAPTGEVTGIPGWRTE